MVAGCSSRNFPPPPHPPPPFPLQVHTCLPKLAPSCSLVFCLEGVMHSGVLQQAKVQRQHLRLSRQPTPGLAQAHADHQQHSWQEADTFTTMLTKLLHSRTMASNAKAVGMLHNHLAQASSHTFVMTCLLVYKTYHQAAPVQACAPSCNLGLVLAWAFCLCGSLSLSCTSHQRCMQTRPKQHAFLPNIAAASCIHW